MKGQDRDLSSAVKYYVERSIDFDLSLNEEDACCCQTDQIVARLKEAHMRLELQAVSTMLSLNLQAFSQFYQAYHYLDESLVAKLSIQQACLQSY